MQLNQMTGLLVGVISALDQPNVAPSRVVCEIQRLSAQSFRIGCERSELAEPHLMSTTHAAAMIRSTPLDS